jgi:hypothetical protein
MAHATAPGVDHQGGGILSWADISSRVEKGASFPRPPTATPVTRGLETRERARNRGLTARTDVDEPPTTPTPFHLHFSCSGSSAHPCRIPQPDIFPTAYLRAAVLSTGGDVSPSSASRELASLTKWRGAAIWRSAKCSVW